jgi:hypothetical protein
VCTPKDKNTISISKDNEKESYKATIHQSGTHECILLQVDGSKVQWKAHNTFPYKATSAIGSSKISSSAACTTPKSKHRSKSKSSLAVSTATKTGSQKKRSPGSTSGSRRMKPMKKGPDNKPSSPQTLKRHGAQTTKIHGGEYDGKIRLLAFWKV